MNTQALSNGGKRGAAVTNYLKRQKAIQAERRTALTLTPAVCKCPACWKLHTVELAPIFVEKGKMPRIFCPAHIGRRAYASESYGVGSIS